MTFVATNMPFVFNEKVEAELDRLQSLGIISPVQFSRWAAPIVPVVKQDGSVRIVETLKLQLIKSLKYSPIHYQK